MRRKWYFCNEVVPNFSEVPTFRPKSLLNPPKSHSNLEAFFANSGRRQNNSDKKGSCVVVWDRNDYIKEAEKQLNDTNDYKDICFNSKLLQELVGTSNKLLQNLKAKGKISDKQFTYFRYQYKKVTTLGKLYVLPKIHKRLANAPGRSVIFNCGAPTEKASEFLDLILNLLCKNVSHISNTQVTL